MANEIRQKRVGDEIRRVLAQVCQSGTIRNLPALTTCTAVEMNRDLSYARCMMSIPGSPRQKEATLARLNKLKGFLRHEIIAAINLRQAPDLRFYLDDSLERGLAIDAKLREIAAARESAPTSETELAQVANAELEGADLEATDL